MCTTVVRIRSDQLVAKEGGPLAGCNRGRVETTGADGSRRIPVRGSEKATLNAGSFVIVADATDVNAHMSIAAVDAESDAC